MAKMPRRGKGGRFVKGGIRKRTSPRKSTALARTAPSVRRRATAGVRRAGGAVKRAWRKGKSKTGGFLRGAGGGIKGALKGALPHALLAGLAFVAVRWGTRILLGTREDGTRRDSGWLGYVGNGVALVGGYWLLRKFAPRFATSWLIGAGAALALRVFANFMPAAAESAGLLPGDAAAEALPPGTTGGAGVQGIYASNMQGIYAEAG